MEEWIKNNSEDGSSCYFLDLRGSTKVIRQISLNEKQDKDNASLGRLEKHAKFMLDIHSELEKKIQELNIEDFYFNDTGDRHMCLFWNKSHSWVALDVACCIYSFLKKNIDEHNNIIQRWFPELKPKLKLGFGIGLHTGGSIISQKCAFNRNYAYGIAINSAARMEGFTKNFKQLNFLLSGNYYNSLESQFSTIKNINNFNLNDNFIRVVNEQISNGRIDIKDENPIGHNLWTIRCPNFFYENKINYKK